MTTLIDRMNAKIVHDDSGCWLWTGALNSRGYSCIGVNGRSQLAHRVMYELMVGPIPDGLTIDHLCRVKNCVNPDHLEPVTGRENTRRALDTITHCPRGHRLDGENLIVKMAGDYKARNCRTCANRNRRVIRGYGPRAKSIRIERESLSA